MTKKNNVEVLFKNSIVNPETGCRIWMRSKNYKGYGKVKFHGKCWSAHRLIYTILIGSIPSGLLVRHSCHNRACINIDHLLLGTNQDNLNDRQNANRQAKGEKNHSAKLTEKDILEIKELRQKGSLYRELATRYQVGLTTIANIIRQITWRHVS